MKRSVKTLLLLLSISLTMAACSKKDSTKPATTNALSAISTNWTTTAWGGVDGNPMNFTIDGTTAIGTITFLSTQTFNFAVGDHLYFDIKANSDGTYSAQGKFTYGTNNENTSTRACTLSLQNNGAQLKVDYPAITNFPELIYIYQKGSTTVTVL